MVPDSFVPTSLPMCVPVAPAACGGRSILRDLPSSQHTALNPSTFAVVTHNLFSIPRVYRQLAETASDRHNVMLQALSRGNSSTTKTAVATDDTAGTISSSSHIVFPLPSSSSPAPAVPPPAKIKAYVGALTRAWSSARDADIPSVSCLLNVSQQNYISPLTSTDNSLGSSQLTNGEFTANPYSHQAAVCWGSGGELVGSGPALVSSSFASAGGLGGLGSTSSVFGDAANFGGLGGVGVANNSHHNHQQYKAPTARDPLLILEWVAALNAVINGSGCGGVDEAFDPEKLWPLREFASGVSEENSGDKRDNAHFFSASEIRSARNFSKSALDRAKKRAALAQKSYAHFSSSEALRGPALLALLLEILAAGGGTGVGGGGELCEAARSHPASTSTMSPNNTNHTATNSSNQLRSASLFSAASVLASPTNAISPVNFEEASAAPTTYYASILAATSRSSSVSASAALLPSVLSSCEEAEKAVIEAALACLYNFIHPVVGVVAHKVPMTAKMPNPASSPTTASPRRGNTNTNRGAEAMPNTTSATDSSDRNDGRGGILLCQTHVAARTAPFEWNEVRSEIGKLRNGPQPPLVDLREALMGGGGVSGDSQAQKPSPYLALPFTAGGVPTMTTTAPSCSSPFVLRTVLIDAFYVKRERSLAAVQKLTKLNVYRPLFALLARHASQLQQQGHTMQGGASSFPTASGEGESTGDNANILLTNIRYPPDLDPSTLSPSAKLIAYSSSTRIVYLCALLISALGGATKQCEVYAAADGMLKTLHGCGVPSASLVSGAGGGAALEGGAGAGGGADSEGDDDGGGGGGADGDDEDDGGGKKKKKGSKKKSSKKKKKKDSDFNGGCSSGPMRLASVTGLAKTGTLARLGGASAALVAALEMALNALKTTNDNTASELDVKLLSSFPSSSSALSPLDFTSAVLSAIATVAVGSPNISFLYKKSIIPLVSEAIDLSLQCCRRQRVRTNNRTSTGPSPCSSSRFPFSSSSSPLFAVIRWSIELLYRLLGPTPAKPGGGMMAVQLSADELSCVKEVFMREFEGLGMLIASAELGAFCLRNVKDGPGEDDDAASHYLAARFDNHSDDDVVDVANKGVASFPSPPLFCAACDVLQVLLSVPSITQTLVKSAAVSGSLSGDSSSNVRGGGAGDLYYFSAVQQRGLASLINALALGAAADSTVTNAVLKHIMTAASSTLSPSNSNNTDTVVPLTTELSSRSVRAPLGAVLVHPPLRAAIRLSVRLSANAWSTVINHVMRVLDVKELPVGTDSELAWFPPPELVEELKRQQQAAAETTAAAKADSNNDNSATDNANPQEEGGGGDDAAGAGDDSDDGDDDEEAEEEDDALGEDVSTVPGLSDLSPELHLCPSYANTAAAAADPKRPSTAASTSADAAAPKIPSHTSILGIASVHHIKPFSSPRPLPSSSSVLNASPPHVEPLLVQPEFVRSEAIKGQLTRLVYAVSTYPTTTNTTNTNTNQINTNTSSPSGNSICCCRVVYDDLTRSTALPKTRIPHLLATPQAQQQLHEAKSAAAAADTALHMSSIAWLRPPLGYKGFPIASPVPQNAPYPSLPHPPRSAPPEIPLLSFDSAFESGNLKRAIHVIGGTEYDLILHADVNTNSFVQWFYFAMGNMTPGVAYRFNILNMEKESSTFNDGQRPLLFSERRYEASGKKIGWTREGYNIAYYKNSLVRRARERYVPKELMDLAAAGGASGGSKGSKGTSASTASANGGAQDANGSGGVGVMKTPSGRAATSTSGSRGSQSAVSYSTASSAKRRSDSASTVASSSSTAGGAKGNKKPGGGTAGGKKSGGSSSSSAAAAGEASQNTFYTLSFTIIFPPYAKDRVYLTNCYPYTYSDLIGYCRRLLTSHEESCAHYMTHKNHHGHAAGVPTTTPRQPTIAPYSLFVQSLCPTLSGNATPLLTITNLLASSSSRRTRQTSSGAGGEGSELTFCTTEEIHKRPVVLLTARVHPGESNASYMIKGCVDFLLNPTNAVAHQLREQFVFKIIPMLNPDGVINGNHRCGLAGTDLNRGYHKPSRWKNPTIFYLKALAHHVKRVEGRALLLYADFHGHSRCHNGVIYGCGEGNTIQSLFAGIAPSNLQSSLTLANALLQSGGGEGAKASEMKPLASTTSAGNAEWPFTCATGSSTAESIDASSSHVAVAATHGYAPQLASAAACIVQQYRARLSASLNNSSPAAVAAAKKLSKNADFIAESFGFSKASNPHPFTLQSYANTSLNYGAPERLLPLLLGFFCPYFSYRSSTFTIQKGKRNTGRVVFYRQLGVRMSYTIEASMMGGVGLDFFTSANAGQAQDSSASSSPAAVSSGLLAKGVGCCDDYPAKAPSFADPYAAAGFTTASNNTKQSPQAPRKIGGGNAFNDANKTCDNNDDASALPEHESLLNYVCARRPDLAAVMSPLPHSLEQTRRMAAQWSIQNNQLSACTDGAGINLGVADSPHALNNDNSSMSVDGNEFISHCLALSNASSAGHFAPKHYTTIGMMMLKSLYHMWGASRAHRGGLAYMNMNDAYRSTPPPPSASLLASASDDIARGIAHAVGTAEDPYYRLCEPERRTAVENMLLPRYRTAVMVASTSTITSMGENNHLCTGVCSSAPQPAPPSSSSSSWPSFNEIMATHVVDPAAAAQLCGIPPSVGTALGVLNRDLAEEEALAAIAEKKPKKNKKKGRKSKKASNKGEAGKKKKAKKVPTATSKLTVGAGSASTKKRSGAGGVVGAQSERLGTAVSSSRAAAKSKPSSAALNMATSGARPSAPAVKKGVVTNVTAKPSPAAGLTVTTSAKRGVGGGASLVAGGAGKALSAGVPSSPSQLASVGMASVPTRSARGNSGANQGGASASASGSRGAHLVLPSVATGARPMTTTSTSPSSLSPSSTAVKQKRSAACTPPLSPQTLPAALITSAKPTTSSTSRSEQPPATPPPPRPPPLSMPSAPQAQAASCAFSGSYAASTRKGSQVPSATTTTVTMLSLSKTKESSLCGCVTYANSTHPPATSVIFSNTDTHTNATTAGCASSVTKRNVGLSNSDDDDDYDYYVNDHEAGAGVDGGDGEEGGEDTEDEGDDDANDGEDDDDDDDLGGQDDEDEDEDDDPNGGDEEGEECEDEDEGDNDNAEGEEDEEIDGDGIAAGEDPDRHGEEQVGGPSTRSLPKNLAARDPSDHSRSGNTIGNIVAGGGGGFHVPTRMGFASFASLIKRRLPIRGGVPVGGVVPMPAAGRNTSTSLSPTQQRAKARRILRHAPQADVVAFCHQAYLQGPVLL